MHFEETNSVRKIGFPVSLWVIQITVMVEHVLTTCSVSTVFQIKSAEKIRIQIWINGRKMGKIQT